jgi:hypothetical protein
MIAHVCNPSCVQVGGLLSYVDQERSKIPYLKNNLKQKGLEVWQV